MNEDEIVRKITSKLKRPKYMLSNYNDDSEILDIRIDEDEVLLETTDTANEGIDYPWDADAWMGAYIATTQSMSDIAACGGNMIGVVTSISVPDNITEKYVLEFSKGIRLAAKNARTYVLGGDYNSANDFSLTVVSLGKVRKDELLRRKRAQVGDLIGVTGEQGRFNSGYFSHHDGIRTREIYRKMLVQDARLEEGRALATSKKVNSCIDMPDGLIRCLKLIAGGAVIYDEEIPLSEEAEETAQRKNMKRYQMASTPAGDLELIFTTRPQDKDELDNIFKKEGFKLSWIGRITNDDSINVVGPNYKKVAEKIGYVHAPGNMLFDSGRDVRGQAMKRYVD